MSRLICFIYLLNFKLILGYTDRADGKEQGVVLFFNKLEVTTSEANIQ